MKYIKRTFEYLFVLGRGMRFAFMFLLSLPFGFTLACLLPNSRYISWGANYEVGNMNFISQWNMGDTLNYWLTLIAVFVFGIITLSILATVVSRSMRVGTFRIKKITSEFNENCFSGYNFLLCLVVILLVAKVILTLLLVLSSAIPSYAISLGLSIFNLAVVNALFFLAFSFILVVLPTMAINGVKLKSAILSSIRKCGARLGGIFFALFIPYLVLVAIGTAVASLNIYWLSIGIDTALYAGYIAYFVALSMVTYYKIEQIKREDYPKYLFKDSENWG
ncbi:MAG: hypothetical protein R3Y23_03290 [Bacillota bacterium]